MAAGAESTRKPRAAGRSRAGREVGPEAAAAQDQPGAMPDEFLGKPQGGERVQAGARDTESESMSSEPSEEDIRLRAYHRYLERGGGHGQDYDDWLEAERELKSRK